MPVASPRHSRNNVRAIRIWKGLFTVGVLAFVGIALLDIYHLLKSQGERASERIPFGKCAICHSLKPKHGIGPSLYCVIGRRIGSLDGYRYSIAMLRKGRGNSGTHWTVEELTGFIANPHGTVPGTRMPFPGLQGEVLPLVEYIRSKCDLLSGEHQLLSIRTDEKKEFVGCAIERTAPTSLDHASGLAGVA